MRFLNPWARYEVNTFMRVILKLDNISMELGVGYYYSMKDYPKGGITTSPYLQRGQELDVGPNALYLDNVYNSIFYGSPIYPASIANSIERYGEFMNTK